MGIEDEIMGGVVFKRRSDQPKETARKTKAKKKSYITGQHGSASAKKKADIRQRRANRPSQKK